MITLTERTQPLLDTEEPVEGWPDREKPYCPTFVRLPGSDVVVTKTPIACTAQAVYSAWEPTGHLGEGRPDHTCITTIGTPYRWYGQIGSRYELPDEIGALPVGSDERVAAVGAWYREQWTEAHGYIRRAFPGREFQATASGCLQAPI